MYRFVLLAAVLPAAALAQSSAPAESAAVSATPAPAASPGPALHRLTPDEIAAAQADGDSRNRAAELLAMSHGDSSLALPLEKRKSVHGEVGFGVDSNGGRTVFGSETTTLSNGATISVAGDYTQFGRSRYRNR